MGGEYNANLILTGSLGDGVKTWDIRRKTQGKSYFYTGVKLKIHGNPSRSHSLYYWYFT